MDSIVSTKIYDLLKDVVDGNIEKYSIVLNNSNKKGEGFLGEISYVSLTDKKSGRSEDLVVKQAFSDEKLRAFHPLRGYYLNEIHFYTKLWPCFQEIQIDKLSKPFDKIPKCLATSSECNNEKIILENLKLQKFQVYEKSKPIDDKHMTYILKHYGRFHAISFAYKLMKPKKYYEITKDLENFFGNLVNINFFCGMTNYVYDISLKGLDPKKDIKEIEKFKVYIENWEDLFRAKSEYHGDYSVVLHGDCWSNNMMFKYNEENQLEDIRLLDFQFAKVGTPVSDLIYCLYSGGSKEIFEQLDHYLRVYHDSLLATLEEFGIYSGDVYPFEALKKEWSEYCQIGFTMGLFLWRVTKLIYEENNIDFTSMKETDETLTEDFKATKYDEKAFNTISRDLIVHMTENGFL